MLSSDRYNQFRIMWLFVFYDLPTDTKKERKAASLFRKNLLKNGFTMFQFSVYLRNCPSKENAQVHVRRVRSFLPAYGKIGILMVTDNQFGRMELFFGKKKTSIPQSSQQLELF